MNRQQYQDRFRNTNIDPREIERKWQLFTEEQANMQTMMQLMEAARSGAQAAVGVGGGGNQANAGTPGDSYILTYKNEASGKIELFTVNFTEQTVGPVTELGITNNADIYYNEIVDGKGYIMIGQGYDDGENGLWFAFIDSAGNVIELVKDTMVTNWNSETSEGLSASVSYKSESGMEVYWWMGEKVYHTTLTNVESGADYPYYGWFGYYNAVSDGTFSIYYNDDSSTTHVYLFNAQGNAVEINIDGGPDRYTNSTMMGVNGTVIAIQYYNNNTGVYDLVRVFETDGAYTDLDIAEYTGNNMDWYLYGTNKFAFVLYPDSSSIDVAVGAYNTSTKSLVTTTYSQSDYNDVYSLYTNEPGSLTDYWGSPEGCETFWIMARSAGSTYDSSHDVYVYDKIKSICLFDGASSFTEDEFTDFAPIFSYNDYARFPTLFCHRDGQANLELMVIVEGASFADTGTSWVAAQAYYEVIALGDLVFTSHYDLDNDPTKQSFAIWDNITKVDEFWTDTDNGWGYNWRVAYIGSYGEDKTYYFTPASGEWKSLTEAYAETYRADSNGYSDYVGNHRSGIVRVVMQNGDTGMLTPDTVTLSTAPLANAGEIYTNGTNLINLYQQSSGDNLYVVEIYDFAGNKLVDYTTYNNSYQDFYVVSDRILMVQYKPDGSVVFIAFFPDYTVKELVLDSTVNPFSSDYENSINDFRWWD